MNGPRFTNFGTVIGQPGSLISIPLTAAIFIQTGGTLVVGGANTGPNHDGSVVNMGSIATGTLLEIGVRTVGTANTASFIPLR